MSDPRDVRKELKRLEHYSQPHIPSVQSDCLECFRIVKFKELQERILHPKRPI